jgi:thioredoxin-like negative regulator of GroEL
MTKGKWVGLVAVALTLIAMIAYKARVSPQPTTADAEVLPRVLLVADLSEADAEDDACAEIIRAVRAARARGVTVQELNPDTKSDLLRRYRVLTIPTVLILDPKGEVVSRFEGEGRETVTAVKTQLERLR